MAERNMKWVGIIGVGGAALGMIVAAVIFVSSAYSTAHAAKADLKDYIQQKSARDDRILIELGEIKGIVKVLLTERKETP